MAKTPLFLPYDHQIATHGGMISTQWLLNIQSYIKDLANTGDVDGPDVSVNNQLVLFDGATGKLIKAAGGTGIAFAASGVASFGSIATDDTYVQGGPIVAAGSTIAATELTEAAVNIAVDWCGGI